MSTNFPTNLDTATELPAEGSSTPLATNHVTAHQNIQDSLEAVEAKIGIDGSAVTTSHDYKLSGVTGSDKAVSKTGTETLTNKTLTSATINGVTPTTGGSASTYLDGTGSYSTPTTVNGSTTVKGVYEAATSSEITAGTATGGTGAVLVVTPDALAASTPVFNGSGITNISGKLNLVTTDVTISNTATETTILSYSLAGGVLGTNGAVRVTIHIPSLVTGQASGTDAFTLRFKYGGTTITSHTFTPASAVTYNGKVEFILAGSGATNTQNGSHAINVGQSTYIANSFNLQKEYFSESAQGTSAIDSTTSQTLLITGQYGSANASNVFTASLILVEKIV